jgi:hypothetical protein
MKITITIDTDRPGDVVIHSLCKSCGNPVGELSKSSPRTVPSLPVMSGIDGPTPVVPVHTVQTDRKELTDPPFSPLSFSPFPTTGLQPHELIALGLMVQFFRERRTTTPILHGDFNDGVYVLAQTALKPVQDIDRILGECWSPRFWKTRPEFTVTVEHIAPNPVILEGTF